jgi:hypothetical protein
MFGQASSLPATVSAIITATSLADFTMSTFSASRVIAPPTEARASTALASSPRRGPLDLVSVGASLRGAGTGGLARDRHRPGQRL